MGTQHKGNVRLLCQFPLGFALLKSDLSARCYVVPSDIIVPLTIPVRRST